MSLKTVTISDGYTSNTLPQVLNAYTIPNNQYFKGRNAANSADVDIFKLNASDNIEFSEAPEVSGSPLATVQQLNDGLDLKIDSSTIGEPDGVAPLGPDGKVSSNFLPSYVDDVSEYADLASLPLTGETGKIYVALDTGKTYRWSGSAYFEVSPSEVISVNGNTGVVNLDTDDVPEGANLYHTPARAKSAAVVNSTVGSETDQAASVAAMKAYIATLVSSSVIPSGIVTEYGGDTAPTGWLLCRGQAVSRVTYSDLYAAIGTKYGAGDGSTTFNVPFMAGHFARGHMHLSTFTGTGTPVSNNATFTAHDIPFTGFRVRLQSGTLTGLSTGTTYYVIVVDANTLAFATSYSNALAGTKIAISGTNSAVLVQHESPDATSRRAVNGGNSGANLGSREEDAFQNITGSTGTRVMGLSSASGAFNVSSAAGSLYGGGGGTGSFLNIDASGSTGARTSTETRTTNVSFNFIIKT